MNDKWKIWAPKVQLKGYFHTHKSSCDKLHEVREVGDNFDQIDGCMRRMKCLALLHPRTRGQNYDYIRQLGISPRFLVISNALGEQGMTCELDALRFCVCLEPPSEILFSP